MNNSKNLIKFARKLTAGKKVGREEEIEKSEKHNERMKLWDKFRDQWRKVRNLAEPAKGLALETELDPKFLRNTYDVRFAHFTPEDLPQVKKEVILQILEKIPVTQYEVGNDNRGDRNKKIMSDEDIKELFSKEILEELVNNHPEFKEFHFQSDARERDEKRGSRIKPIFFELLSDYLEVSTDEIKHLIGEGDPEKKRSHEDIEKGITYYTFHELMTHFIKERFKKE